MLDLLLHEFYVALMSTPPDVHLMGSNFISSLVSRYVNDILVYLFHCPNCQFPVLWEQHAAGARGYHQAAQVALLVVVQPVDVDVGLDGGYRQCHVHLESDFQYLSVFLRWCFGSAGEQDPTFTLGRPLCWSGVLCCDSPFE